MPFEPGGASAIVSPQSASLLASLIPGEASSLCGPRRSSGSTSVDTGRGAGLGAVCHTRLIRRWATAQLRPRPPRHDEGGHEHLDDFAELVAGLAADGHHAAVRPGLRRL